MKIVNIAYAYVDKLHKGTEDMHALIDVYNAQDKLPRGVKATINSEYCAIFTSTVCMLAGSVATSEIGAWEQMKAEQRAGRFHKTNPLVGDIIFYKFPSNYHVGIVTDTSATTTIQTVEGNVQGGQCKEKTVRRDDPTIVGFSTPVHENEKPTVEKLYCKAKTLMNMREEPSGEIIGKLSAGKLVPILEDLTSWVKVDNDGLIGYVSGKDKYIERITIEEPVEVDGRKIVNEEPIVEEYPSKTPKWVGKATTLVNVRTSPELGNNKLKEYPTLSQGKLVDVCDTSKDGAWYYIRIDKKYFGWVSVKYIVKA